MAVGSDAPSHGPHADTERVIEGRVTTMPILQLDPPIPVLVKSKDAWVKGMAHGQPSGQARQRRVGRPRRGVERRPREQVARKSAGDQAGAVLGEMSVVIIDGRLLRSARSLELRALTAGEGAGARVLRAVGKVRAEWPLAALASLAPRFASGAPAPPGCRTPTERDKRIM